MATEQPSMIPTIPLWFHDAKAWLAIAAIIFALGGAYTVLQDTRHAHESISEDTNRVLSEHKQITEALVSHTKTTGDATQALLQEIVRVSRVSCVNTASNNSARQACLQ